MWIAIQCHFGFECVIGEDLDWVCDKAGVLVKDVKSKYVEGMKAEVWNGEKLWVVEKVDSQSQLQSVIDSILETRKPKF